MKIEFELISVDLLEAEAKRDFETLAHGISSKSEPYVRLNAEAHGMRMVAFRELLKLSASESEGLKNFSNPGVLRDMGDLISKILHLCSKSRRADLTILAVPQYRAMLYAGIDPLVIEEINEERYRKGIESMPPGFLQLEIRGSQN